MIQEFLRVLIWKFLQKNTKRFFGKFLQGFSTSSLFWIYPHLASKILQDFFTKHSTKNSCRNSPRINSSAFPMKFFKIFYTCKIFLVLFPRFLQKLIFYVFIDPFKDAFGIFFNECCSFFRNFSRQLLRDFWVQISSEIVLELLSAVSPRVLPWVSSKIPSENYRRMSSRIPSLSLSVIFADSFYFEIPSELPQRFFYRNSSSGFSRILA